MDRDPSRCRSRTVVNAATAAVFAIGCCATLADGALPVSAATVAKFPTTCVPRPAPIPSSSRLSNVSDVVHGRLVTYTMTSPAVGVTHVNVLLPTGYNRASSRRYPVLYLLHGALGSYADWASTTTNGSGPQGGNVESLVGRLPAIVVMPDDSPNGSYSDWFGIATTDAALQPVPRTPAWETYDIDELVPWVDSHFPTKATAAGRVIAGLSSGGGGAAKYAAAHPGLFGFVGTFSGAVDNDLVDASSNTYSQSGIFHSASPPDDRCVFGDPFTADVRTSAFYWYDNDPTYTASNLEAVKLFVTSGNGKPSAADANTPAVIRSVQGAIESVVDDESHHFVSALRAAGLGPNLTTDFYGNGVHSWHYWQRDLTAFLEWLRPQLGEPVAPPSQFSYRTARTTSSAWGWSFRHDSGLVIPNVNTAEAFVYLTDVSARGLTAAGNGSLRVTTPEHSYPPGSTQSVRTGGVSKAVKANRSGQLTFTAFMGAPATHPQLAFPAAGPPPGTPRVRVSISPAAVRKHAVRAPRTSAPIAAIAIGAVVVALALIALWRVRRPGARSAKS